MAAAALALAPVSNRPAEAAEKPLEYTRLAIGGGTSYHTHKPQTLGGFHGQFENRQYFFDTPGLQASEGVFHGGIDLNILHLLEQEIDPDSLSVHAGVDIGMYWIGQKGAMPPFHIGGSVHLESHNWGAKLDIAPGDVVAEIGHRYGRLIYRRVTNHLLRQDEESIGVRGHIPLGERFSIIATGELSSGHEVSFDTRKYISLVLNFDLPHGEHRSHNKDDRHPKHHDHTHD